MTTLMVQEVNDDTCENRQRGYLRVVFNLFVLCTGFGVEALLYAVALSSPSSRVKLCCFVQGVSSYPPHDEGKEEADYKHHLASCLTHRAKRISFASGTQEGGSR